MTSTKRTKKNAGMERQKEKTRTNQQQKKKEKEQTDAKRTEKRKRTKKLQHAVNRKKKKEKTRANQQQKEKRKKTVSRLLVQNASISLSINIWVRKNGFKLIIMVKALVFNDKDLSRRIKLEIIFF